MPERAGSAPALPRQAAGGRWPRHPVAVATVVLMLAVGAVYVPLRAVTPSDGAQVLSRTSAWSGAGVSVAGVPGGLRRGDLVTAIDGVALGSAGARWQPPAARAGDGLTYDVVRGGSARQVTVTLRRPPVAAALQGAWATIAFVVVLFAVAAYLHARRANPATAALLVLGGGLLGSTVVLHVGVSASDARGGAVLWLYLVATQVVYVAGWSGGLAFALLFPRPLPPLTRHPWLLPAVYCVPPAFVAAWALATLGGGTTTGWVGDVILVQATAVTALMVTLVALVVVRVGTTRDRVSRQQLKWLGGGGALSATLALALWFLPELITGQDLLPPGWLGFSGLPLIVGLAVAVGRYRLFDLDRIVSRTIAYALLTVLLGACYGVVVLALGQVLGRRGENPSLAVAGATLAVAATFQPLRRRVQGLVDRRFNRRRYDAERTIAAFSTRLRQQTDLDALTAELLAVVDQTMQPTRAALWLRQTEHVGRSARIGQGGPHGS